jgi:hypothetical protein
MFLSLFQLIWFIKKADSSDYHHKYLKVSVVRETCSSTPISQMVNGIRQAPLIRYTKVETGGEPRCMRCYSALQLHQIVVDAEFD